jgi:hypothetical protein
VVARERAEAVTLQEAIRAFRKKHMSLYRPAFADGKCGSYSYQFIRFLQDNFVIGRHLARELHYRADTARHHPLRPKFLTVRQNEDLRSDKDRPVGGWTEHCVVKIGRMRIDWTARQFDKKAPVPLIWRTKT